MILIVNLLQMPASGSKVHLELSYLSNQNKNIFTVYLTAIIVVLVVFHCWKGSAATLENIFQGREAEGKQEGDCPISNF